MPPTSSRHAMFGQPPEADRAQVFSGYSRRSATRRKFLKHSVASLAGLTLTSCGWRLADVRSAAPAQAQASDTLHIYTWSSYVDQKLVEVFQANTGFKVVVDIFDSNETMLARMQTGGGANYSIIYPTDYMVVKMRDFGLLTLLDQSRISGLDNLLPQFRKSPHDPGNQYSVPMSWGTTGLIYNRKYLKQEPTDWKFLWDNKEKLSRRITLLNDVREVMGATLRMLGYSYNSTNIDELQKAFNALTELKPAIRSFTSDAWQDPINAGDLWVAMGYSSDGARVSQDNPDLKYVIPKSGTSLWSDTLVIPKTAPNPSAAYAWINYILQPSLAADLCERLLFATPNQAAFEQLPKKLRDNKGLFPDDDLLQKSEGIVPVGKFLDEYDRFWTKLTSS